jgi:hypothetical protein
LRCNVAARCREDVSGQVTLQTSTSES